MVNTFEAILPVTYDEGIPSEIQIKDLSGNVVTYKVRGWRRESSKMMTVIMTKEDNDGSILNKK